MINRKTFRVPNVGTNIISRREHCIAEGEENAIIGCLLRYSCERDRGLGKDLKEERGRGSRQVEGLG